MSNYPDNLRDAEFDRQMSGPTFSASSVRTCNDYEATADDIRVAKVKARKALDKSIKAAFVVYMREIDQAMGDDNAPFVAGDYDDVCFQEAMAECQTGLFENLNAFENDHLGVKSYGQIQDEKLEKK